MLGVSLIVAGCYAPFREYYPTASHVSANLLLLSMVGLIMPTMGKQLSGITDQHITRLSRGIVFIFCLLM